MTGRLDLVPLPAGADQRCGSGWPFMSCGSTFFGFGARGLWGLGLTRRADGDSERGVSAAELCATGDSGRGGGWTGAGRGAGSARGTGRRIGPSLPGPLPDVPPIASGRSIGCTGGWPWPPGKGAGWRTVTLGPDVGAGAGTGHTTGGAPTVAGGVRDGKGSGSRGPGFPAVRTGTGATTTGCTDAAS